MHTLTKDEIANKIFEEIGLSKSDAMKVIGQVLDLIGDALKNGETVKIPAFASFNVLTKSERIGRNPKTGEEVKITPRRVVSFRSSRMLREGLNA